MKATFKCFYPKADAEKKEIWEDCIFCYDANILLNLYRYSETTRDDLIKVIKHYKDRTIIPYQVGYEYHQNRLNEISNQTKQYNEIIQDLEKLKNSTNSTIWEKYNPHSFLDTKTYKSDYEKSIDKSIDKIKQLQKIHPDWGSEDIINSKLTTFFDGCIADPFEDAELTAIYKEGKTRYDNLVPPGYCDLKTKKDKGQRAIYGDLIVWKSIIKSAIKEKKNVVFVTDDSKEDWWLKNDGKTISPRPELIKEFYDETKKEILIYRMKQFLDIAKSKHSVTIKKSTITEVEDVSRSDLYKYIKTNRNIFDSHNSLSKFHSKDFTHNDDLLGYISTLNKVRAINSVKWDDLKRTTDWLAKLGKSNDEETDEESCDVFIPILKK